MAPYFQSQPPRVISKDLRPIFLTGVLLKLLERIVGGWKLDIMFDNLDVCQYGGLKG